MTSHCHLDDSDDLLSREAALCASGGSLRMRDAATRLGVPEAALLEARLQTGEARRLLHPPVPEGFGAVISRLGEAGELMALTRNEACVHEKHGRYARPDFHNAMGQVVGEIDLRLFTQHWKYGYVLDEQISSGNRRSLQFFDAAGVAIHKVYPTGATHIAEFLRLTEEFVASDANPASFVAAPGPVNDAPDAAMDVSGLRTAWDQLQHTHEFFGLLRRFGVGRAQAMRLAGPDRARPVPSSAASQVLREASGRQLPIMIFVGNPGCVQIHSGVVGRIEVVGPWLNVLDRRFNLHLRQDLIVAAYVVRKPSVNGDIHSLELYDGTGTCICQIFGERRAGGVERADWRRLVTGLSPLVPC